MNPVELSTHILEIQRQSRTLPPIAFRRWCFSQLQKILQFTSAVWWSMDEKGNALGATAFEARPDLFQDYFFFEDMEENRSFQDAIVANDRRVVNSEDVAPVETLLDTEIHKSFYSKHGIVQGVGYSHHHAEVNSYSIINIHRNSVADVFSRKECEYLNLLLPQFAEAALNNFLIHLLGKQSRTRLRGAAVCTRNGRTLFEDSNFRPLLNLEWPKYNGRLPPVSG